MQTPSEIRAKTPFSPVLTKAPDIATAPAASDPILVLRTLDAIVYDWDLDSDALTWGPNVSTSLAGLPAEGLASGAAFAAMVAGDSASSRYQAIHNGQGVDEGQGASFRASYRLVSPEGVSLEVEDFGRWFADEAGRPRRAHGILRVLSRGAVRITAQGVAPSGNETSFSARRGFNAWVDERCAVMPASAGGSAMLILGIVNLAAINRREGYDAADDLILAVGRKLARSLRTGDRIVRYSGGKFALFVSLGSIDRLEEAAARLARIAGAEPFDTCAGPLNAEVRIGAALAPSDGRNAHLLLQRAEQAYDDAEGSRDAFAAFSAHGAIVRARRHEARIGMEIAGALDEHRVALAFQTVAPTKAGVAGFEEALLRVVRRDGKVIGPQIVLPVAEKLGLSRRLDERVLDIAIERLATDRSRRLSVNICASALRSRVWLDRLMGRLEDCPGVGERLILEILETQAIEDVEATARAIRKIKRLGVRIAMDDFGAGHTSFRNLRELGVDIVKIDGAFVQNLARSQDDRFFVRTLAALARHLGIETVAEWVEDLEAIALLTQWGIDYLQGHAIGRPKFSAEIETPRRALSARKRAAA